MLIDWKGQGPLAVHDPRKSSNYKLASVIVCTPGVNKLDDAVWKELEKNTVIAQLVKDGKLVITREADGDAETASKKAEAVELTGLKPDDCKRIVEMTWNVDLLRSWADNETRPKVRTAIEKQLKLVEVEKKKQGDEE